MKTFFAFVAIATVVYVQAAQLSEEQKQKLKTYHKECATESKVQTDLIEKLRKGEFPAGETALKNHVFCVAKKIGLINDDGEIQRAVLKAKLSTIIDPAVADKLIDKCAVKAANGPDTSFNSIKCFHDNTPDHIVLV